MGRLTASMEPPEADAFIIAVPTPSDADHTADLTYVRNAVEQSAPRLRGGGLQYPVPTEDHPGTAFLFGEQFPTPDGKATFHPAQYADPAELPDDQYPFVMCTGRQLYHWHTGTMTRRSSLDAIWPEAAVEMHPADADRMDLHTGDWVKVSSRRGAITLRALVTGRSPEGVVFIPFHFFEAAANELTLDKLDPQAFIPEYKAAAVRVTPATEAELYRPEAHQLRGRY